MRSINMATKKTTTTTEEIVDETSKEVNYAEDIKGKTMQEVGNEESKTSEPEKEEVKEEIKEDPPKDEEKEVDFDPEKLKEEISTETANKIVEALKGADKEQTKENVNAYKKFVQDIWDKEKRTPTYDEVLPLVEDAALQRLEARQVEKEQRFQEEQKTAENQRNEFLENFKKELDEEEKELYVANKLPKIKDPEDPNDYGRVVKEALYARMAEVNRQRVAEGQTPIRSISRVFNSYFKMPAKQPAGADAPIGGTSATSGSANEEDDEINYLRDIRSKSWKTFFRR